MMNTTTVDAQCNALIRDFQTLRFLAVLPAALLMTLSLIWGMERLIHTDQILDFPVLADYTVPNPILDIKEPQPLQLKKPEPPKQVEAPPAKPELALLIETGGMGGIDVLPFQEVDVSPNIGHFASNVPVATLMMQPTYPAIAASKGYEGYVDVQFNVAATGATENVVVIASNPAKVFDRAAVQAVKKWKYSPVTVDGVAQRYEGMVQRITFELAD